mgnify:CR=1 FL=1
MKIINFINGFILDNFEVNFTFLNIVNKKNMYERLKKRNKLNRYDKFDSTFYSKVQKGFLNIAKKKRSKYQIINSNLNKKINRNLIINKINQLIGLT